MITKINVHQLRNIKHVSLNLASCNLMVGLNGSGKTSLLEAVFLLSRGKTFRHHEPKRYITHHTKTCTVWAATADGATFALQKTLDATHLATTTLKVNNIHVSSQSTLSFRLPTLLIDPSGMAILEEGSGSRRQLLDWLCFHLESQFYPEWLAYQRLLKQRNALLKSPAVLGRQEELVAWDRQLSYHAHHLHTHRQAVFERWQMIFQSMLERLLPQYQGQIELNYLAGFDATQGLFEVLKSRLSGDIELGYTRVGAHRADVSVVLKKVSHGEKLREQAANILSRGEKKLLIVALRLSQLYMICEHENAKAMPMVLIDDIDAELDNKAVHTLLDVVLKLPCQIIISSLNIQMNDIITQKLRTQHKDASLKTYQMFHVKHGEIYPKSSQDDSTDLNNT
ncbi:DNA replication/repair protein RecF [Moraxella nasovis]|uniref:DNA replication/repair protein RecF n=1 Tax=Moraxella nasovis TaxID=2904121 RepID=UPI0035CD0551